MAADETVFALSLIERLLREEKLSEVDQVLSAYEVDLLQPATLLGVITLTRYAKEHLTARENFVARSEVSMTARLGSERTQALLKNRR